MSDIEHAMALLNKPTYITSQIIKRFYFDYYNCIVIIFRQDLALHINQMSTSQYVYWLSTALQDLFYVQFAIVHISIFKHPFFV